jgi:RNA polymerase sigma factor (sigma-70 family)
MKPHALAPFFAVQQFDDSTLRSWQVNRPTLRQICADLPLDRSLPPSPDFWVLNSFLHQQLPDLSPIDTIVTRLYQQQEPHRDCWLNFIHFMAVKTATYCWRKLPAQARTPERSESLSSPPFIPPQKLFTNFQPPKNKFLLGAIEAWTYQALKYHLYSYLRQKEPFFGLTNLGVVSKSSVKAIQNALFGEYPAPKMAEAIELVKAFKHHLKTTGRRVPQLTTEDWQTILPATAAAEIAAKQQWLDQMGQIIRRTTQIPVSSLDDPTFAAIPAEKPDREYDLIIPILQRQISQLPVVDRQLLCLFYGHGLNQSEIAQKLGKDQPTISKQFRAIHIKLLQHLQQEIDPSIPPQPISLEAIAHLREVLREMCQYTDDDGTSCFDYRP